MSSSLPRAREIRECIFELYHRMIYFNLVCFEIAPHTSRNEIGMASQSARGGAQFGH